MAPKSPARLGVDELAEGVRPAGDVEVGRVVGGQLEEPADGRAALVELAGRVQEARAVAGGRRAPRPVAQERPDPGERLVARRRRGDERLEAQVRIGRRRARCRASSPMTSPAPDGEPEGGIAVQRQAVAAGDRLDRAGRSVERRSRPRAARAGRGSAAWPPRRSAGRTDRCRATAMPAMATWPTSQRTNSRAEVDRVGRARSG